jgi:hypothetical protein
LLLRAHFNAIADYLIRCPGVECHSLEITFGLNCLFLILSRTPSWTRATLACATLCLLLKSAHFVAQGETTLDVSSFLLTAENYYYAEGCRDFEA